MRQVVEMLCNKCARTYEAKLGIPLRMECTACGGDILTPAEELMLYHIDTGEELACVLARRPFRAYSLEIPKTVIARMRRPLLSGEKTAEKEEPPTETETDSAAGSKIDVDVIRPSQRTRKRPRR